VAGAEAQTRLLAMGEQGMRVLLTTARSADAEQRAAAAVALGLAGYPNALPTLKQMLRDADQRVKKAAEAAIKTIAP
jgi:HEAT repeat protein